MDFFNLITLPSYLFYTPQMNTSIGREKKLVLENIESRKTKCKNYVVSTTRCHETDIRRGMINHTNAQKKFVYDVNCGRTNCFYAFIRAEYWICAAICTVICVAKFPYWPLKMLRVFYKWCFKEWIITGRLNYLFNK